MERYTELTKERLLNVKARINEASVPRVLTFINSNGTAHDITSYNFQVIVKKIPNATTNLFKLTVGDGLTIGGTGNNELQIDVSQARAEQTPNVYFWRLFASGEDHTWLNGDWEFFVGKYDGITETDTITISESGGDVTITIEGAGDGGTGDVVGPSLAADGDIALFDGTTGKLIKTSGTTFASLVSTVNGKQTAFGVQTANLVYAGPATGAAAIPTFRAQVIADLPFSGTPDNTKFARGDGTWAVPAGSGSYTHNTQTASYVLVLGDAGAVIVEMNVAGANTVTVPPNSSVAYPVGSTITVAQYGAGLTTIVPGVGVTINSTTGSLASPGQYATMILEKRATNEWYLWYGEDANANLDQIAVLSPSNDDILQVKAGVWTNRTLAQYKADLALNLVENTALSTWAGTANITTLGTVGTGTWNATNIALGKGGTGSALADPGANTLWGWDDTDNSIGFWTIGSGLAYDHATHTLSSSGSGSWANTGTTTLAGANIIDGTTTNTILFRFNSLSVTAVEGAGLMLINETDAALGAQQISPSLTWKSEGWATTSSTSRTIAFKIDSLPIQGTTNPSGTWILKSSVNAGAYTAGHIVVNTSGAITIGDSALGLAVTIGSNLLISNFYTAVANNPLTIRSTYSVAAATGGIVFANNGSQTITSGTFTEVAFTGATFSPTSGTGVYNVILVNSTVNQTSTASGTITFVKVSPTYTSVTGIAIGFDYSPVSGTPATNLSIRTTGGTVMFNASTKSANTGVGGVIIGNAGTNATGAQTDGVVIHSKDSSAGSANATLAFYLEQAAEAIGVTVATHKLRFWHNGTEYYWIIATV